MGDKTGIQWTDATWNPIVGCSIVSPACTNCYAMAQAARIVKMETARGHETHYADTTRDVNGKTVWTGVLKQAPEHILLAPLHRKKPRRIFVNSMSDLFHESVPEKWIDEIFAIMALCPQHTFQVLTKRPKRMREYINAGHTLGGEPRRALAVEDSCRAHTGERSWSIEIWPLPNVSLGVTAERQKEFDERTEHLRGTPAAVRFVSIEPMLGPIDASRALGGYRIVIPPKMPANVEPARDDELLFDVIKRMGGKIEEKIGLDWVICGGESGPNARPRNPAWARSLRDQCAAAGVAYFDKQHGEYAPIDLRTDDLEETDHLFPTGDVVRRVGKSRAGRLLDGREHNEFPEAP